jgi:hypothetical protein
MSLTMIESRFSLDDYSNFLDLISSDNSESEYAFITSHNLKEYLEQIRKVVAIQSNLKKK